MSSQMQDLNGVVVMYCPSCGVGVQDRAGNFMREYACPECGRPGYFRQTPPLAPELTLETPAPATPAPDTLHYGGVPNPQTPANMYYSGMPPVAPQVTQQAGGLFWKVAAVVLAALALGGLAGWRYTVTQQQQTQAQQAEESRKQQVENEFRSLLNAVLAQKDLGERIKGLQALQIKLKGSGLPSEQAVQNELVAALAAENAAKAATDAEQQKRAAYQAEEAAKKEAELKAMHQAVKQREVELAEKEAQAAKAAELQKTLQAKEKELADKEKQQQEMILRLQQIENKLSDKASTVDAKESALKQQQQQWVQDQAIAQQEAAKQLAAAQEAAKQAAAQQAAAQPQQVVIVKEPVPVTTTYIVRETPAPVYINTWSWSWGPRPRPIYIGPGPRPMPGPFPPFPGPSPRPPHH